MRGQRESIVTIPRRRRLLLAVVLAFVVALAGCTSSTRSAQETEPAAVESTNPISLKGTNLAHAQSVLESEGWTVTAVATKKRSIKNEGDWQVVKVVTGEDHTVTLTVGKLTTKIVKLPFKTRTTKLSSTRIGVRKIVQEGERGKRVITFLDGKKISSEVTRKPVTKIIGIGTWRPYTGNCTILGYYAHRYVRCTGYYDPAAKRRAKSLADLCNSTTSPIAACRDVYGRTFT